MTTARDTAGALTLGGVRLAELAFDATIGTPTYVYDLDGIAAEARALEAAFEGAPHLVAYAVKANTAGPIVRTLAEAGCGADVVSGAELRVALACGIDPERIVFSGVAKSDDELSQAIACADRGIGAIQIESLEEIARVAARARSEKRRARVSLRINPGIEMEDMGTHAHIATGHDEAKFGIEERDALGAAAAVRAAAELELVGVGVHAGSQFTTTSAYEASARACFDAALAIRAAGASLRYVDTGGGFGIDYGAGCAARPADFVRLARALQREKGLGDLALYVEPGRSLVAAHGVLLARVIQPKVTPSRRWLMIDAGMNDLLRPALYQARHRIVPLDAPDPQTREWRVVGPVCESSDDFGAHAFGDAPPRAVAILDAGAYGFTMASRYNGRPLPAEVFLRGGRVAATSPRGRVEEWIASRVEISQ